MPWTAAASQSSLLCLWQRGCTALLCLIGGLCDLGEGLRPAGSPEGLGLPRHSLRARFPTSTVHSKSGQFGIMSPTANHASVAIIRFPANTNDKVAQFKSR
jgi:hypothetical protein